MILIAQAVSAAPITITGAASSSSANTGIFNVIAGEPGAGSQMLLSIPGSGRLNGTPFRVKASGYVSFAAGTFTATIQPLLYASTSAGFTASAAAAIVSVAAAVITVSAAIATTIPWTQEVLISGDSLSGTVSGSATQLVNNQTVLVGATAPVAIVNIPTSINFSTEPPLQFAWGCTIGGTANDFPTKTTTSALTGAWIEA